MKYKAKYGAESEIPADVKAFYTMVGGEWVFNGAEFSGLAELLNPGLANNRDALKTEKDSAVAAKVAAEKELATAQAELSKVAKPGTIILDAAEHKLLEDYKALGPIKDVQEKLKTGGEAAEKLAIVSQESSIRQLAKSLNLNADALVDFKLNSERGKNVVLAAATKKVKDAKGVETEVNVPVVKITQNVDGKDKESEVEFSKFAADNNYPEYLVAAIFNNAPVVETADTKKKSFQPPTSFTKKVEGTENSKGADVKSFVDRANSERSTRRLPWSAPVEKTEN